MEFITPKIIEQMILAAEVWEKRKENTEEETDYRAVWDQSEKGYHMEPIRRKNDNR